MNWNAIIENLGIFGILAGFITWLIKAISQKALDKNLKAYELQLQNQANAYKNELDQSLEKFKNELQLLFEKANKLHSKRLDRIEKIYEMLIDFQNDMTWLVSGRLITGMTPEEVKEEEFQRAVQAEKAGAKLFDYYSKHKLYFNNETCSILDEIIKLLRDSHIDFSFKYIFGTGSAEFEIDRIKKVTETVREKVPKVRKELEENFRKIIGVE
ncbi:hypothetical protein [Gillisia sp. Hel_I_29]|uniref:hypothetical protein n=1 Tax=Gillisia sp. Hel_I_29 TaxID=1249975 RepID=UPI000551B6CC|nr:hypothetical protein [Gillisia sp. Hel_I_29]